MKQPNPKKRKINPVNKGIHEEAPILSENLSALSKDYMYANNGNAASFVETQELSRNDHLYIANENGRSFRQVSRANGMSQSPGNADGMFKSNMFKLQVEELLAELRPGSITRTDAIEKTLQQLKTVIEAAPDRPPLNVLEAENNLRRSHKVAIPFVDPRPPNDARYKLAYLRPTHINAVGSYVLQTATKSKDFNAIDLFVAMPKALFDVKDFMNYRYFHKRAYYVACLAAALKGNDEAIIFKFAYQNGNPLQPILVVDSGQTGTCALSKLNFEIHILAGISDQLFPKEKILPGRNCIRPGRISADDPPLCLPPTPFYNATICSEISSTLYRDFLQKISAECDSFRDCCVLGRIWLQQRGIGGSIAKGGFGHFEWAVITASLLRGGGPKGIILSSHRYSSYQLFKATLQFLCSRDLITMPLLLKAGNVKIPSSGLPMFFDGDRGMNALFKMSPWSYRLLCHEARISVNTLNDSLFDHFDATFITKTTDPLLRFDAVVDIPISAPFTSRPTGDFDTPTWHSCRRHYETLDKGLGDRVHLVHLSYPENTPWPVNAASPTVSQSPHLFAGLLINATNAERVVDHGPPVEHRRSAAVFRKFWGDKAELRRFKDGSILESLIWSNDKSGASIIKEIVLYLLTRHHGMEVGQQATFVGDSFYPILAQEFHGKQPELQFQSFMTAFGSLDKGLRALEGMPLQLRQISPADSALRYSSVRTPGSSVDRERNMPANVVIQFEGSGRWPDDVIAIQRTKVAFLLKMGELIAESLDNVAVRTGLENERNPLLNGSFLEVVYTTGLAFRFRIHNEREQTLLERELKCHSHDVRYKEQVAQALSLYKRSAVQLPLHTQAVQTLCTRYPLLSPTIRLVKTWFDRHLLSTHFAEEVVELMVIGTFVRPHPWQCPSSLMTGFLRTLHRLSRWNWQDDPLIVDLNGELTNSDVEAINTQFTAWRTVDPGMNHVALFVASKLDLQGICWTERKPSKVVAARMTSLARSAYKVAIEAGLGLEPASLFARSTADYDFVIHLRVNQMAKKGQVSSFKNLRVQTTGDADLVGYNPVDMFFEEIQTAYGENIIFFRDVLRDEVIAGLWNPQTKTRSWKVQMTYCTEPSFEEGKDIERISINKSATLNEIVRLGGEMVDRIDFIR